MWVTRLALRDLRCLHDVELQPGPGLNLLVGGNGAGKTSVLEGLHLMAYGRGFRGRVRDGLVRTGSEALQVFVEWSEGREGRLRRAGLRHAGQAWEGRLDGAAVAQLGDLCAALMAVSFEPGSHALISGGSEPRRRLLDWGLFHVEQDFLPLWRRYARALKQRNALLKAGARDGQLDSWDHELAEAGEPLSRRRRSYLDRLQQRLPRVMDLLGPGLGVARLDYQAGWRSEELSLADALLVARDRDRAAGHTSVGPHRADWRLGFAARPAGEALSRGQAKLAALGCLMTQAEDCAASRDGDWPVILLDDLASELDRDHQQRMLAFLRGSRAQVFITGTELPAHWPAAEIDLFHVEQGGLRPLPGQGGTPAATGPELL